VWREKSNGIASQEVKGTDRSTQSDVMFGIGSLVHHEWSILGSNSESESNFKRITPNSEKKVVLQVLRTLSIFICLSMTKEATRTDLIFLPFFATVY
jgi:hypothetical protein